MVSTQDWIKHQIYPQTTEYTVLSESSFII